MITNAKELSKMSDDFVLKNREKCKKKAEEIAESLYNRMLDSVKRVPERKYILFNPSMLNSFKNKIEIILEIKKIFERLGYTWNEKNSRNCSHGEIEISWSEV